METKKEFIIIEHRGIWTHVPVDDDVLHLSIPEIKQLELYNNKGMYGYLMFIGQNICFYNFKKWISLAYICKNCHDIIDDNYDSICSSCSVENKKNINTFQMTHGEKTIYVHDLIFTDKLIIFLPSKINIIVLYTASHDLFAKIENIKKV